MSLCTNALLISLLLLVVACAAPQQPTPTVTFATVTPTPQAIASSSSRTTRPHLAQAANTATLLPANTPRPSLTTTRAPANTHVPTPTPQTPEIVYAIEPLQVLDVKPEHGAQDVPVSKKASRLVVRFNFPVVPLSVVNLPNAGIQPAMIEPAIEFEGRWLNSFTYAMLPTGGLDVATQYTVTVKPTKDLARRVSESHRWSFTTLRPSVLETGPEEWGPWRIRGVSQPITLTFSTEMERGSVEKRLRVMRKSDRWTALGTFAWDGNAVGFTPTYPFEYDTEYLVELLPGAQDAKRITALGSLARSFVTVKPFAFTNSLPQDGSDQASQFHYEHEGLRLDFTQPVAESDLNVSVSPSVADLAVHNDGRESYRSFRMRVSGAWQPATAYTVTVHSDTRSEFGESLGKDSKIHFTTAPAKPYAWIHLPELGLYDANGPQTIYASYANIDRIDYNLYRVPRDDVFRLIRHDGSDFSSLLHNYSPPGLEKNEARAWSLTLPRRLDASAVVSTTLNDAFGKPAAAGVYILRATAPNLNQKETRLLFVSPYNLALKYSNDEALVWVTDLGNGKPAANLPLTIYSFQGDILASGRSDSDGIFRARLEEPKRTKTGGGSSGLFVVSEAPDGNIVAATTHDWNQGIQTWDYELAGGWYWDPGRYHVNVYTDRPVYRAGQTVYFKGIVREIREPAPGVPANLKRVAVSVVNSQYSNILQQELEVNEFGSFHGQVALNENAPTGSYSIHTEYGSLNFMVAQYRRPEFQVELNADRADYTNGDKIRVKGNASYFFGGPVADAAVTWRVMTRDLNYSPDLKGWWSFFDDGAEEMYDRYEESFAQQIRQGKARTDADGNFEIELPAGIQEYGRSQEFTVEAEIEDINHQSVANRARIPVHRGTYYIGLRTPSRIGSINKDTAVDVLTLKADASTLEQVAIPFPSQPLSVSIYRGEWVHGRMQVDGHWQWTSSYSETLMSKMEIVTDDRGAGVVNFAPPQGGHYRIAAQGKDGRGNSISSATWFWVPDNGFVGWKIENNSRINLVADKQEYVPGEVAEILVPAPFADAEALFTLERDGILQVERVSIEGNTAHYTVPIVPEYAPNIFVSAMLVKGRGAGSKIPQFKMGYVTLNVKPVAQTLSVQVSAKCAGTSDGGGLATNDEGQVTDDGDQVTDDESRTTVGGGRGVRSPNYGLARTRTNDKEAEIATCQPQENATIEIEARDAKSQPVRAEFSVALTDKAVQSLVDDNSMPLLESFYGVRRLGVNTATSLVHSVERENELVETRGKGGGGGGGEGEAVDPSVRREFLDTAFWKPIVVTDENGRAQVEVKLPDNLTTWNVTVKGVTRDTLLGEGHVDLLSTKPLIIRPVTPRFFVVGDTTIIEAVLNNNLDEHANVSVTLGAEGLTLKDGAARGVEIAPRSKASVRWETTTGAVDEAKLLFTATVNEFTATVNEFTATVNEFTATVNEFTATPNESGDGTTSRTSQSSGTIPDDVTDAVELTLPVNYPETTETLTSVEPVEWRLVKSIEWNESAGQPMPLDQLEIELTPSIAAASRESLNYLKSFRYECVEQTTSKFLPNIATYLALKRLNLERKDLEKPLQISVSREIQRLYVLQNPDGGWGWWQNLKSRPALTAYALYALASAQQAGFGVDAGVMSRAENFLNEFLNEKFPVKMEHNLYSERALTLFVLAEMGRDVQGRALNLFEQREMLDLYGKAFLMMALDRSKQPQTQVLLSELADAARVSTDYVSWREANNDDWMMSTDTRTHAIVLMAIARIDPKHPYLPRAVKWLMDARKPGDRLRGHRGVYWETTQETAWAVMGLAEWMLASGELSSTYAYRVSLNETLLGEGTVDPSNVDQTRTLRLSIQDTLANLANQVIVTRDSTQGTLYYSAYVRRYADAENIPAITRGIVVERTYYAVDPLTLNGTSRVIESAKAGDYVRVKLTISTLDSAHYLAVEDLLPAGFEPVDTSLKTFSSATEGPMLQASDSSSDYHPYWWYWGHSDIRDDRVALFAEWLGRGTYEYTYVARATVAGTFHALPARAYAMYDPTVLGQSAGAIFTVEQE